MSDLRDLYQEVILDHSRNPRQFRVLEDANCSADGYNPLCGDKITIYLRKKGDAVEELTFQGSGCAISMASASMMTQALGGRSTEEIQRIFESFRALVTGELDPDEAPERLGKLAVFAGVGEFPVRVKCATLAWHTLRAALAGAGQPVSTE
jgi:nitrogen fixation NifU-like protein